MQMQARVDPVEFTDVNVFIITPSKFSRKTLNSGEAEMDKAIMMAGYGHIKVISVDYRMPPDFPFPAAIDNAVTVYREILKTNSPENIGIFKTSTGGGITLTLMLRAKAEGLPLPAAIAVGTPWTDLSKTGDSYFTHEGIDNVLVSYEGWLADAAKLYANGQNLKNPLISPIYGDVQGFPPTLLFTSTRDRNTIRMHLKLREAGVAADLIVFKGLPHAQYLMTSDAPETKQYFNECVLFFNRHLAD